MKLLRNPTIKALGRLFLQQKIAPNSFDNFLRVTDDYLYYVNRSFEQQEDKVTQIQHLKKWLHHYFPEPNFSFQNHPFADLSLSSDDANVLFFLSASDEEHNFIDLKNANTKSFYNALYAYFLGSDEPVSYYIFSDFRSFYFLKKEDLTVFFEKNPKLSEILAPLKQDDEVEKDLAAMEKTLKKTLKNLEATLPVVFLPLFKRIQVIFQEGIDKKFNETEQLQLVVIYKLFSSTFLFQEKEEYNDNALTLFYQELLHILGLEEAKKGQKTVLVRGSQQHKGSLIESTITKLKTEDGLYNLKHPERFGERTEDRYFGVALELSLTWLNRILFLKTLENQLVTYNFEDADKIFFYFMQPEKIQEYDTLNTLFFEVLALEEKQRDAEISKQYSRIPYLNSSLFEVTKLERKSLRISNLRDNLTLPIYPTSILFKKGKEIINEENNIIELKGLDYLMRFLSAFDFGIHKITPVVADQPAPFISMAGLGLILEQLSRFDEGAYQTPLEVVLQITRRVVRQAVVLKIQETYPTITDYQSLKTFFHQNTSKEVTAFANEKINALTICDPAVGSGRFLVTALHELLVIKSELGILCDTKGNSLAELVELKIEAGDLIIYEKSGKEFQYKVSFSTGLRKLDPNAQRIQEAIFHEKKHLIEHCLFGVDQSSIAVKICRLRLWLELLKSSHYRQRRNTQLETLPNIDINIKTGNALISRFPFTSDLNEVFRRTEYSVDEYKKAVRAYKKEEDKSKKRLLSEYLEEIKSEFSITMDKREKRKIAKIRGKKDALKLQIRYNKNFGYDPKPEELEDLKKLETRLAVLEAERDEILSSKLYKNAFEWRFEFPEVLNEQGDFEGFDVVLTYPPHQKVNKLEDAFKLIKPFYEAFSSAADLYELFLEQSVNLAKPEGLIGVLSSNKWLQTKQSSTIRKLIGQKTNPLLLTDLSEVQLENKGFGAVFFLTRKEDNKGVLDFKNFKHIPLEVKKDLFPKIKEGDVS